MRKLEILADTGRCRDCYGRFEMFDKVVLIETVHFQMWPGEQLCRFAHEGCVAKRDVLPDDPDRKFHANRGCKICTGPACLCEDCECVKPTEEEG